ncbi:TOG array regulator of axonemal microtubules protein 1 [Amphibalanus amphitrite]|uniref:TOG array regulator of axonemal microtubules protein 1 n=1 Tax=Amphibalanus amphitrite TaxID=1232801 RepID=A0A6A4X8L9_AMPAM|nr:TOG array regulator of axonemal microtubules protein 1 [Amphibalanus amphitrite]
MGGKPSRQQTPVERIRHDSDPNPLQGKSTSSAPQPPGHRYSYHGDSPSSTSLSPTPGGRPRTGELRLPRLAPPVPRGAAARPSPPPPPPVSPPLPYLFRRPAALRLRLATRPAMASAPAAELAQRCCRRWPAADVLVALQSLPPDRRRAFRGPLLTQLEEELRKLSRQSQGAAPSRARSEAILSFLEPHLLLDGSGDQQPEDLWSWAEWRGRVQRWTGWPAPDRSPEPPPAALWHRFIGRAAPAMAERPHRESAEVTDVGATDRCELLKRELIHGLAGLGDMLRRDNSSRISYGGTDQVDRVLRAPTKHSQFAFTADDHSGSSDEDPNGITLSNTTRSKLKLLTKRNEMRKGLERAGHREPADPHHAHKEERVRNGRHPEAEGVNGAVHSRLGSHLSGSEKQPHAPPSPSIERKSGSMQNLATHRPKQPTLPKSKTFGADMNKSSVPSSASSVFGQQLERFANPRQALDEAYRKLNSDDWEREVSGLTDLVRLFRHHPDTVSGDLKAVVAAIVKQMKNLRSQVLRAAVQTSAEMFQHVGRAAEPNMESMVAILLQKTSDTNKFIKADSNRALDMMLENVSVSRAVAVVIGEGLGHRSSQVRATVARLLAAVVTRLGPAGSLGGQKDITDKLVPAAAQLVREGDLQTRIHAKEIFHVWLQHPDLDKVLSKYLNSTVKRDIDKVIDNIRNEVPAAAATLKSVSLTLVS